MKYYLLDEEKLRTILENKIVKNEVNVEYEGYSRQPIYSFKLKNVTYEFLDYHFLISPMPLIEAIPSESNSYALTTEGFIEWKNPSKIITYSKGTNIIPVNSYFGDYGQFCSSYICVGDIPPKDAKKINKDNIRFDQRVSKNSIEEKENELIIKVLGITPFSIYVEHNGKLYDILHISGIDFLAGETTIIIYKGSCFDSLDRENALKYITLPRIAFCYD